MTYSFSATKASMW